VVEEDVLADVILKGWRLELVEAAEFDLADESLTDGPLVKC
jgi:hypothetical protein